jgi:hypothetical protein
VLLVPMISVTLYTLITLSFDRVRHVRDYCGQPVTEHPCLSPMQPVTTMPTPAPDDRCGVGTLGDA